MPFFIKSRKRKALNERNHVKNLKEKKKSLEEEEIESDSDVISDEEDRPTKKDESSSEEEETAEEKKLRLAKQYLAHLAQEEAEKREDEEIDKDIVSHRLRQDILEQSGKLQKQVADKFTCPVSEDMITLRGHQLSVTCIIISPDGRHVFSGSKDCSLVKWDIHSKKKVAKVQGGKKDKNSNHIFHTDHILCLAISSDNKYLASGGKEKVIHIWNPDTLQHLHRFYGHKDFVSGLAFRKGTHQLFSASHDRSVKIWNTEDKTYIETLFGHQDCITAISSLSKDRAVTSGGRDGSVRLWKVPEESQLVFHGHKGSIDALCLINENNFISGADDNSVAVWSIMKKKPTVVVWNAHGSEHKEGEKLPINPVTENWITAVASLQHTDLVATGSKDGCIRFWKCGDDFKSLKPLFEYPVVGFVNSLQFSSNGDYLVAGIGQEHRMGRWWKLKEARNGVCVLKLKHDPF